MCDKSKLLCNFAQIFKEIVMRKRFIHILWAVFGTGILTVILAFVAIWFGMIGYMPDIEDLQNPINRFATQVYSADGKVLGTWNLNKENRIVIPYKKMSPYLIKALVATEDERFYEHSGIDFRALGRAIVKRGILGQTNAGGGSTITQQLAKQLYSEKAGSTEADRVGDCGEAGALLYQRGDSGSLSQLLRFPAQCCRNQDGGQYLF